MNKLLLAMAVIIPTLPPSIRSLLQLSPTGAWSLQLRTESDMYGTAPRLQAAGSPEFSHLAIRHFSVSRFLV